MLPIHSSPPDHSTSVPLIRGDPSVRSVAKVQCLRTPKQPRTAAASPGAAALTSDQETGSVVMPGTLSPTSDRTADDHRGRHAERSGVS